MSLYQKVRPKKLDGIIGNSNTIGALKQMLRQKPEDRPHSIMLKGPSGCGKTTIALILASEFGSDEQGILTYNAANTRGIDTIREIEQSSRFTSLGGGTKTYILDESHQLTSAAQEALLRVIEDNPPHCYFIFCTTEPEKLIKTVRNRCAEYEVGILNHAEIKELLRSVAKEENIKVDNDIIEAIQYTCEGSPRSAIVSLEQVIELDIDAALEILVKGTERATNVIELCKLLVMKPELRRKKWKQILTTFVNIQEDNEVVRRSIMTFIFNRLVKCENEDDAMDMTRILDILSHSTFYGGKAQLGAKIAKICIS